MDNLYIWQETVQIGDDIVTVPCKKICFEKNSNSDNKNIIDNAILGLSNIHHDKKIFQSEKKNTNKTKNILIKSYLPTCIIKILSNDELSLYELNLNEQITPSETQSESPWGAVEMQSISSQPPKVSRGHTMTIIFNDMDLEREKNKNKILSTHSSFCIMFTMDKIIKEILTSFTSNKKINYVDIEAIRNIENQIKLDFPRMEIYFGSKKCVSFNKFIDKISKYNKYSHNMMYSVYYLILMFCTQASFFYPFNTIHNIYTNSDNDIHIIPSEDFPKIYIVDNKTSIDIIFKNIFKYTNINSDEIITRFHTFMVITIKLIEKHNRYIFSKNNYGVCDSGMLYWIKENNLLII